MAYFSRGEQETRASRGEWQSVATGQNLAIRFLEPSGAAAIPDGAALPAVLYLLRLAAPRAGTESDATIIDELRASGYLVVTVDFALSPRARVPYINRDLSKLRDDIRAKRFLTQFSIDDGQVYLVPAGHRLRRSVPFYREKGRTLALDIIYPSRPKQPVGAVLEFSCDNQNRMGNTSLSICSNTILDGAATEGFAVAFADHPVAPPYKGLDPMPDAAWKIKAAVRALRAAGKTLRLSGRIVPVGFSRGSGMALMLVTTNGRTEFEDHGENQHESSAVVGAVVLSGRFTYTDLLPNDPMLPRYAKAWGEKRTSEAVWRQHGALDYLTPGQVLPPLFLSINVSESTDALHQMQVLHKRLSECSKGTLFLPENTPRGHKVPLDPTVLHAIDQYLKSRLR